MKGTRPEGDYQRVSYTGINGKGKSGKIVEALQAYDPSVHKCLILCGTTPAAYAHIKRLHTYDNLRNFESGIALFWDYDVSEKQMLKNIVQLIEEGDRNGEKYLQNGVIVFDDASNYLGYNPPEAIAKFLGNHRMYHLDLIFVVHSFFDLSRFIRRRITHVRIFKTNDNITAKQLSNLGYNNADSIYEAWVEVMNHSSSYHNLTLKTGA